MRLLTLQIKIVNLLHNLRIVDYGMGHTGSAHDAYAFESTRVYQEHDELLEDNEWIWADSAYPSTTWCVPPFKRLPGRALTRRQRKFNYRLATVRVRSEHAIGLLKGRFQSLRELRIQIGNESQHEWALVWIRCCIILHNIILDIEGDDEDALWRKAWAASDGARVPGAESDSPTPPGFGTAEFLPESDRPGYAFRESLVNEILRKHYPELL